MSAYDTSIRICNLAREAAEQRYNAAMAEIKRELADPTVDDGAKAKLRAKLHNLQSEMRNGKVTPTPKVQDAPKGEEKA